MKHTKTEATWEPMERNWRHDLAESIRLRQINSELLEACKRALWLSPLRIAGVNEEAWEETFNRIETAINKAEGRD